MHLSYLPLIFSIYFIHYIHLVEWLTVDEEIQIINTCLSLIKEIRKMIYSFDLIQYRARFSTWNEISASITQIIINLNYELDLHNNRGR